MNNLGSDMCNASNVADMLQNYIFYSSNVAWKINVTRFFHMKADESNIDDYLNYQLAKVWFDSYKQYKKCNHDSKTIMAISNNCISSEEVPGLQLINIHELGASLNS